MVCNMTDAYAVNTSLLVLLMLPQCDVVDAPDDEPTLAVGEFVRRRTDASATKNR